MTPQITFKENSRYLLEQGIFNRITLTCTWVTYTTAYLKLADTRCIGADLADYRYEIKSKKLYVWNGAYQSWDSVEAYTLSAYGSNDAVGQASYESYKVI